MRDAPYIPGITGIDGEATLCHHGDMRLTARDASILHSLDRFGQLDAGHIWRLHFPGLKSRTSWDQVSQRLLKDKYIARMGRRMVMGDGSGSGKSVFQLGAEGWRFLGKRGVFRPRFTAVSEHRLKIADAFMELCAEEDAGRIKIRGYYTEPDTHMKLAGVTVRPDFYVDIELIAASEQHRYWLEIDRDNESRTEIERKARDYVAVYDGWREVREVLDPIPRVLFLSDTEIGRNNLEGYLKGRRGAYEGMITVDDLQGWAGRIS